MCKVSANRFLNQSGGPFSDLGPDPACVADPDTDPYHDEVAYNIVSNPVLEFADNTFDVFHDDVLEFPGADNVPLGSLSIKGNRVKCDCESLKELVALVDFEHVVPREHSLGRGAVLFRKEFYDSGVCYNSDGGDGEDVSLKAFAREWVSVVEPGEDKAVMAVACPRSP